MDERNERLVFDQIVQSCCSSVAGAADNEPVLKLKEKPQYFLVSPKLLQGLR